MTFCIEDIYNGSIKQKGKERTMLLSEIKGELRELIGADRAGFVRAKYSELHGVDARRMYFWKRALELAKREESKAVKSEKGESEEITTVVVKITNISASDEKAWKYILNRDSFGAIEAVSIESVIIKGEMVYVQYHANKFDNNGYQVLLTQPVDKASVKRFKADYDKSIADRAIDAQMNYIYRQNLGANVEPVEITTDKTKLSNLVTHYNKGSFSGIQITHAEQYYNYVLLISLTGKRFLIPLQYYFDYIDRPILSSDENVAKLVTNWNKTNNNR